MQRADFSYNNEENHGRIEFTKNSQRGTTIPALPYIVRTFDEPDGQPDTVNIP